MRSLGGLPMDIYLNLLMLVYLKFVTSAEERALSMSSKSLLRASVAALRLGDFSRAVAVPRVF